MILPFREALKSFLVQGLHRRLTGSSLFRFVLVGGLGEGLYLLLYALAIRAGSSSLLAISLAGATCLLMNAFLHARISFRLQFRWRMLGEYALIQAFCLMLALLLGWLLEMQSVSATGVGLVSLLLWSSLSFVLTRFRYRRAGDAACSAGLTSRQTSQRPR